MPEMELTNLKWRGKCDTSACLEIATHDGIVYLRNSNDPDTVVVITDAEWLYFITNVA